MSDLLRDRANVLRSLDPDAPLDDLEPLRDIVGDARVVAVGEGCHFVREFTDVRRRIVRFLAERCGFTVLAFEFGFAEGRVLDRWIQGAGGEQWAYPMGYYLARELDGDYRAVALTHTAGSVPEMHPDDTPGTGFSVVDTPMPPPPPPGSVEGALAAAGLDGAPTLTDLRPFNGGPFPDAIRSQSADTPMAVADAFDGVLSSPTATPDVTVSF